AAARRMLGLEVGERFALVCPNIPYDAGYESLLTIFPSMSEWLIQTVKYLASRTDIRIVVRAHPGEENPAFGDEKIHVILGRTNIDPRRYILLHGLHELNTYTLMGECDFGVVFSSTTGVEMAMHGKPVLTGARIYYSNRGFTVDATDRDDYF